MESKVILFCIVLVTTVGVSKGNIYCDSERCLDGSHTLCLYEDIYYGDNCVNPEEEGMTSDVVDYILKIHNHYRFPDILQSKYSLPVPDGANPNLPVMPLEWDMELAFIAQKWANQCEDSTDTCRDVDRFAVTQRVSEVQYYGEETPYRMLRGVQYWSDEEARMFHRRNYRANYFVNNVGYALPWDGANRIGCGYLLLRPDTTIAKRISYFVCNYGYLAPNTE